MKNIHTMLLVIFIGFANNCIAVQKNIAGAIRDFFYNKKELRIKKNKHIAIGVAGIAAVGAGAGVIGLVYYLWNTWKSKKTTSDEIHNESGSENNSNSAESDQSNEQLRESLDNGDQDEEMIENVPVVTQEQSICEDLYNFFNKHVQMNNYSMTIGLREKKIGKNELIIHFYGDGKIFGKTRNEFNEEYKNIFKSWAAQQKKFSVKFHFYDTKGGTITEKVKIPIFKISL